MIAGPRIAGVDRSVEGGQQVAADAGDPEGGRINVKGSAVECRFA